MATYSNILQACNNKKRIKRTPTVYNLHRSSPFKDLNSVFRDNIRWFLHNCCEPEDYCVSGHQTWSTLLVSDLTAAVFPLYTVEEHVENSSEPFCNLCRCVGWGNHFVAKRRYHLIIPRQCDWNKALKDDSLESENHILHGMIHCTGFGHLITLNGGDNESSRLSGTEVMDLWDCICTTLRARKITVLDASKTGPMELRLIHGVAYGSPWFGKWGYKFCRGSFGVTEQMYKRATELLSSLELRRVCSDFFNTERGLVLQHIVRSCKEAADSELVTIGDLLSFMLELRDAYLIRRTASPMALANDCPSSSMQLPNNSKLLVQNHNSVGKRKFVSIADKSDSRWPRKRLEQAAKVIADILKGDGSASQTATMTRHELREAARQHIGDTGLIDHVLKSIGNTVVGNYVIRRVNNSRTRTLEFSLHKVEEPVENDTAAFEPRHDLCEDILFIYSNVLFGYPETSPVSLAASTILNSKHFVKEFEISLPDSHNFTLALCQIRPSYEELETRLTQPLPPGELILLPKNGTLSELESQAQTALRDTYFLTANFTVRDVIYDGLESKEDTRLEFFWVRGQGLALQTRMMYEAGWGGWEVDCDCGARSDDGERMVECETCKVWGHTKCNGIQDGEAPPPMFLCKKCERLRWDYQGRRSASCSYRS